MMTTRLRAICFIGGLAITQAILGTLILQYGDVEVLVPTLPPPPAEVRIVEIPNEHGLVTPLISACGTSPWISISEDPEGTIIGKLTVGLNAIECTLTRMPRHPCIFVDETASEVFGWTANGDAITLSGVRSGATYYFLCQRQERTR